MPCVLIFSSHYARQKHLIRSHSDSDICQKFLLFKLFKKIAKVYIIIWLQVQLLSFIYCHITSSDGICIIINTENHEFVSCKVISLWKLVCWFIEKRCCHIILLVCVCACVCTEQMARYLLQASRMVDKLEPIIVNSDFLILS